MLSGYGWCVLRAWRPADARAIESDPDRRDDLVDRADRELWRAFRAWMESDVDSFLKWDLQEQNNNARGVLTFSVSRNHRRSGVWAMLDWIAAQGPGSYGLLYVHDDEAAGSNANRFRVHRLLHGDVVEMDDPFFGEIWPDIED